MKNDRCEGNADGARNRNRCKRTPTQSFPLRYAPVRLYLTHHTKLGPPPARTFPHPPAPARKLQQNLMPENFPGGRFIPCSSPPPACHGGARAYPCALSAYPNPKASPAGGFFAEANGCPRPASLACPDKRAC